MADERETERSVEVGLGSWSPLHLKFTQTWRKRQIDRSVEFLETVGGAAELSPDELKAVVDGDERVEGMLLVAGERIKNVTDADYRDALATLIGAAVRDDALIDEATMALDDVLTLGPGHLRVLATLAALHAPGSARWVAEQPGIGLSVDGVTAALDRLVGVGFVLETTPLENDDDMFGRKVKIERHPGPSVTRTWVPSHWGRQALRLCNIDFGE